MEKMKIIMIIILSFILLIICYSYFIEPNILIAEKQTFKLKCLKNEISDKKIIQISDLHFNKNTPKRRIANIIKKIKSLNPALIFITGDLIDNKNGIDNAKNIIYEMSEICPVYIIFGNWDYYVLGYNINDFKKDLENAGAIVLINQTEKIKIGEEEIDIIGADYYTNKKERIDLKNDDNCQLVLAHSPEIVHEAIDKGIEIVLAGHTHGGQIYIPFITKSIIPVDSKTKNFYRGFYREKDTQIYVNRGIGMSTLPFRFLVPPEILCITLEKD